MTTNPLNPILSHPASKAFHELSPKNQNFIQTALIEFVNTSIMKFAAGQKEHGGSIMDRDLANEIDQELIDIFWYQSAQKRKQEQLIRELKNRLEELEGQSAFIL